jgi:hypothetical protein
VPVEGLRGYGLSDIEHGQETVWWNDRDLLERVEGQQIRIPTEDHLGTATNSHL